MNIISQRIWALRADLKKKKYYSSQTRYLLYSKIVGLMLLFNNTCRFYKIFKSAAQKPSWVASAQLPSDLISNQRRRKRKPRPPAYITLNKSSSSSLHQANFKLRRNPKSKLDKSPNLSISLFRSNQTWMLSSTLPPCMKEVLSRRKSQLF